MNKEELAEYIIRNIIFVVIFLIMASYAFSTIILPQIQNYKIKRDDLRHTQLIYIKEANKNTSLNSSINQIKNDNKILLGLLQSPPSIQDIKYLAQNFFDVKTIKFVEDKNTEQFTFKIYTIRGTIKTPSAFFDFTKKLKESFPTSSIVLPFSIKKTNPLDEMLNITLHIQIAQEKSRV